MDVTGRWIVGAIVAVEVAFWVLLFAGLSARYLLRLRRTSAALLLAVPLVDVLLIVLVGVDLARGAEPAFVHGLAAVYLGFSVGFGHRIITRVDAWFAHRFAGGPPPARTPQRGPQRVRHEWNEWFRVALAWAVASLALLIMDIASGWSPPVTLAQLWDDEIWSWIARLTLVAGVWLLAGPGYALVFQSSPADEPTSDRENRRIA